MRVDQDRVPSDRGDLSIRHRLGAGRLSNRKDWRGKQNDSSKGTESQQRNFLSKQAFLNNNEPAPHSFRFDSQNGKTQKINPRKVEIKQAS